MNWKFEGDGPIYHQIMDAIRSAILAGEYQPGQRIPAVRELATVSRVNPNTMQRALMELEREGILVGMGTIGRVVTTDESILARTRKTQLEALAKKYWSHMKDLGCDVQEACQLLVHVAEQEEDHE